MAADTQVLPAKTQATEVVPPVVLFVPGIAESPSNTAQRVAELMALELTRGEGTFTV